MRSRRIPLSLAATALLLAACSPDATGPGSTGPELAPPTPAFATLDDITDRPDPQHLVVFRGKGPKTLADFEDAVSDLGGAVVLANTEFGFAAVSGLDDAGAATLLAMKDVAFVEEDQVAQLDLPDVSEVASMDGGAVASPSDPTTSFFFPRQWGLRAIGADQAWAAGYLGSPNVTVAILDTGIDYTYPDLNGLVDLSRSASFQDFDDFLVSIFFPTKHPVTDLHYHGTHVASTVSSNGLVVSGVTSQTTLIGVKVCDVFGSCPSSSVFAGIIHAADNGADVINMSLGGGFPKPAFPGFVSLINQVTNYARSKGALIVVSAGNSASDLDHNGSFYSTYCDTPAVACVSATGPTFAPSTAGPFVDVDTPTPYTNFGRSAIHVAAPGGTGTSVAGGNGGFVWQACSQTSLQIPICQTGNFTLGITGTSMASPHAAGVAALLVDVVGGTPGRIRAALQQTADDLGQRGTDPFYGKGRVNAAAAVGQ